VNSVYLLQSYTVTTQLLYSACHYQNEGSEIFPNSVLSLSRLFPLKCQRGAFSHMRCAVLTGRPHLTEKLITDSFR